MGLTKTVHFQRQRQHRRHGRLHLQVKNGKIGVVGLAP